MDNNVQMQNYFADCLPYMVKIYNEILVSVLLRINN